MNNAGLESAYVKTAELRESGQLVKPRSSVQKWLDGETLTRGQSLRACCERCMGGPDNPGYKRMVAECTAQKTCPLWPYRPHQHKSEG